MPRAQSVNPEAARAGLAPRRFFFFLPTPLFFSFYLITQYLTGTYPPPRPDIVILASLTRLPPSCLHAYAGS